MMGWMLISPLLSTELHTIVKWFQISDVLECFSCYVYPHPRSMPLSSPLEICTDSRCPSFIWDSVSLLEMFLKLERAKSFSPLYDGLRSIWVSQCNKKKNWSVISQIPHGLEIGFWLSGSVSIWNLVSFKQNEIKVGWDTTWAEISLWILILFLFANV